MFTGIIGGIGRVLRADFAEDGGLLELDCPFPPEDPLQAGESIAVNGVCLTTVNAGSLRFDLAPETLRRSTLDRLGPGDEVNLERAMRPADRFGGHLVQGHVDGIGQVLDRREAGNATIFRIGCAPGSGRLLVERGSVAVDGISLTVSSPAGDQFEVWIIPHTLRHTTLRSRQVGDAMNLEFDAIAKWVERLVTPYLSGVQ